MTLLRMLLQYLDPSFALYWLFPLVACCYVRLYSVIKNATDYGAYGGLSI